VTGEAPVRPGDALDVTGGDDAAVHGDVTGDGFADALRAADGVEGWLTDDQARRLFERARALQPGARILEIGSFRGRSAIVLAHGAAAGVEVIAVDPHLGSDRGPQEIAANEALGDEDAHIFAANLERAGVRDHIRHVRLRSQEALRAVEGPVDLLYVDGAHRLGPAREDIMRWGARVPEGGRMLVHDSFSSIGVTLALLSTVTLRGPGRLARRVRPGARAACGE
jgi:predicted O-methyltransferase YrrM